MDLKKREFGDVLRGKPDAIAARRSPLHARQLIFLHIHKTGGLSLRNLILRSCRGQKYMDTRLGEVTSAEWNRYLRNLRELPPQKLAEYRLFFGHMPFGLHTVLPEEIRYVTFLRDPVKRMTSYFRMLHRDGWMASPSTIDPARPDWNLRGHPSLLRTLDNGQTRLLAATDLDLPFGQCTEEHLQTAQNNLDRHFDMIGLTEKFNLSLMLLRRLYGWKWHFYIPKNVAPSQPGTKSKLAPEVTREIERLNRFDRALYNYANERLLAQARSHGLSLRLECRMFSACNRMHHRFQMMRKGVKRRMIDTFAPSLADKPDVLPE